MSQLLLASLGIVCPSCDGFSPAGSPKCMLCGVALQDGGPPARAPAAAPAPRAPAAPPPAPAAAAKPGSPWASAIPTTTATARKAEAAPPGLKPAARPAPAPAAPPPQAAPAARPAPAVQASKYGVTVLAGPAQGQRFRLPVAGVVIGRTRGSILFGEDPTVSAQHATLLVKEGGLFVRDEASLSGVYVTVAREPIASNGFFSAGRRLFRFSGPHLPPGPVAGRPHVYGVPVPQGQPLFLLEEILIGGRPGRAIFSSSTLITVGQTACDLSFPGDQELAVRHVEVTPNATGATVQDLSGGLGTFVRIQPGTERPLHPGDRVRIGQQVLRIEALA